MTPRPGLLRGSKIKNYKGSNALRLTWSPPPGFSNGRMLQKMNVIRQSLNTISLIHTVIMVSGNKNLMSELSQSYQPVHEVYRFGLRASPCEVTAVNKDIRCRKFLINIMVKSMRV